MARILPTLYGRGWQMDIWWIVGIAVVAFILAPAIGGAVHTSEFSSRFQALGDISGMEIQSIIDRVGAPTAITAIEGGTLYQWVKNVGFNSSHYAIAVDADGKAIGFQHQFNA